MLYDPWGKDVLIMNFEELEPFSFYVAQMESLPLDDMPANVTMQFGQEHLRTWMFEPLKGVVLGTCGPQEVSWGIERQFSCDMPVLIFVLILEGSCHVCFDQKHKIDLHLEKNMFFWGDWSSVQVVSQLPKQTQYCHVSFFVKKEDFQQNFGIRTGEKIFTQLQHSLAAEGKDVSHISGVASPELITTGRRLLGLSWDSHLDILELKAISVAFVSKMMRHILGSRRVRHATYSHQDIETIKSLKRRLETDFLTQVNVLKLCADIGMCRSKASTIFKHLYSTTIGKYHHACKLAYAYDMLASKQRNVSECAYELGYTNIGHFINAFRNHYSFTPGEILSLGKVSLRQDSPPQLGRKHFEPFPENEKHDRPCAFRS